MRADCPVCTEILTEEHQPTATRCGHIYCAECIGRLFSTTGIRRQCPVCRQTCGPDDLVRLYPSRAGTDLAEVTLSDGQAEEAREIVKLCGAIKGIEDEILIDSVPPIAERTRIFLEDVSNVANAGDSTLLRMLTVALLALNEGIANLSRDARLLREYNSLKSQHADLQSRSLADQSSKGTELRRLQSELDKSLDENAALQRKLKESLTKRQAGSGQSGESGRILELEDELRKAREAAAGWKKKYHAEKQKAREGSNPSVLTEQRKRQERRSQEDDSLEIEACAAASQYNTTEFSQPDDALTHAGHTIATSTTTPTDRSSNPRNFPRAKIPKSTSSVGQPPPASTTIMTHKNPFNDLNNHSRAKRPNPPSTTTDGPAFTHTIKRQRPLVKTLSLQGYSTGDRLSR